MLSRSKPRGAHSQEDPGRCLKAGLCKVGWACHVHMKRGEEGVPRVGHPRHPHRQEPELCPRKLEALWLGMRPGSGGEHGETRLEKEIWAGSCRVWNARRGGLELILSTQKVFKGFELENERRGCALGPLKRQPGVV